MTVINSAAEYGSQLPDYRTLSISVVNSPKAIANAQVPSRTMISTTDLLALPLRILPGNAASVSPKSTVSNTSDGILKVY